MAHYTIVNANSQRRSSKDVERWKEKNDCTVRALENAVGIGYDAAYDEFTTAGRRQNKGTRLQQWAPVYVKHGLTVVKSYGELAKYYSERVAGATQADCGTGDQMTLGKFIKENKTGTHVLILKGHALCIKNGTVYDSHPTGPRTRVKMSFSVEQATPKEKAAELVKADRSAYCRAYYARKKAEKMLEKK